MDGDAGAQLFNLPETNWRDVRIHRKCFHMTIKQFRGWKFLAFEVAIDLFSEDAGTTSAIGVVTRNHSDPSPAKMLDELHQGVYLVMRIFRLEKGRFVFVLRKAISHFQHSFDAAQTWKKSLGIVLKNAGNCFLSLRQAQLEK